MSTLEATALSARSAPLTIAPGNPPNGNRQRVELGQTKPIKGLSFPRSHFPPTSKIESICMLTGHRLAPPWKHPTPMAFICGYNGEASSYACSNHRRPYHAAFHRYQIRSVRTDPTSLDVDRGAMVGNAVSTRSRYDTLAIGIAIRFLRLPLFPAGMLPLAFYPSSYLVFLIQVLLPFRVSPCHYPRLSLPHHRRLPHGSARVPSEVLR